MKALLLVDLQIDFMPGGALAVRDGDATVAVANALLPHFAHVACTQDWHPADHGSFASQHPGRKPGELVDLHGLQQVLWPDHCVQGTAGARFHPDLRLPAGVIVHPKGQDRTVDSYSGFFDNGRRNATGLGDALRLRGIRELVVLGLATDYCVQFTALDAVELGFGVTLVTEGCRAVDLTPGDGERAIQRMQAAGARIQTDLGELTRALVGDAR